MKTIYTILISVIFMMIGISCQKEKSLAPEFVYTGPIPAIVDGSSEAQKICYRLYQKYDLHVYYTLSGKDALRTNVGWTQINMIEEEALPMQAGDEETSLAFLTLMEKFFNLLPEELVKSSVIKRNVLVKVNTLYNNFDEFYTIGFVDEAQQGIAYWGEMDDEIGIQPEVWKYSLCNGYFTAQLDPYISKAPKATKFGNVSDGLYAGNQEDYWEAMYSIFDEEGRVDMDLLKSWGFVNPIGYTSGDAIYFQHKDMATYATWITNYTLEERQEDLENYPLLKQKYDLTIQYFKDNLNLDLETFSKAWLEVSVID